MLVLQSQLVATWSEEGTQHTATQLQDYALIQIELMQQPNGPVIMFIYMIIYKHIFRYIKVNASRVHIRKVVFIHKTKRAKCTEMYISVAAEHF